MNTYTKQVGFPVDKVNIGSYVMLFIEERL